MLCRCLPLYVREDCTIDMSFISVLAVALVMGPAGALVLLFLTTPLEIVPTESGTGFYHIFNTDPHKLLFNTSNLNLSLAVGGAVYYALGGTPGNISLPGILLPAIGYVISAVGTNALIISGVFYLESRMRFFSIFGHMLVGMIPSLSLIHIYQPPDPPGRKRKGSGARAGSFQRGSAFDRDPGSSERKPCAII